VTETNGLDTAILDAFAEAGSPVRIDELPSDQPGRREVASCSRVFGVLVGALSQSIDSSGPLKKCPRGHRIRTLSSGPSVDRIGYRYSTSAGRPHRAAPVLSI
jgi:hypothetical protein